MTKKTAKSQTVRSAKRSYKLFWITGLAFLVLAAIYRLYIPDAVSNASVTATKRFDAGYLAQGRTLAANYCQTCHLLPDPSLLDKGSWQIVLPIMGQKMGIKSHRGVPYQPYDRDVLPSEAGLSAAMNEEDWQKILDYYTATAPSAMPRQEKEAAKADLSLFSVLNAPENMRGKKFMSSYVKIDNSVKPARVFVFEAYTQMLFLLNPSLKILDSVKIDGIVTDISISNGEILALTMGDKLNMLDTEKIGKVFPLEIGPSGRIIVKPALFEHLATSIKIVPADLNGDQRTDYLISEFGFLTGALSWQENLANGTFKKHVIRNVPGSIDVYLDKSKSGAPDLWVLFAQGNEGIFHFINKGNGRWEEKQILKFPPVYGSSSFGLVDMNNDGFNDIVYTCGDNADYSLIYKPYHGVYIYLNDGRNNFSQKYFYPINGCYKVIAKDFRNSGNKDLAVIAFFTNPTQPEESFTYLENKGNMTFTPHALPANQTLESILTMESGDLDGDGKTDVILGNAFPHPGRADNGKSEPFFILLKNRGRK